MNQYLLMMRGLQPDELAMIQELTKGMNESQEQQFYIMYSNKRKDQQTMLLLCLLGIIGFAGIHRFVTGDVVLGIIYFLTCGLCFIGTIVDAANINSLTYEHNRKEALQTAEMVRMMIK